MLTYYICGYLRNKDGPIRKNANRAVLAIAHSKEEAAKELQFQVEKYGVKYDYRIFNGLWKEVNLND